MLLGLEKWHYQALCPFYQIVKSKLFLCRRSCYHLIRGGFDKIAITDLTQATQGFIKQWETLDFPCHGLITGYFKNQIQLEDLAKFASEHNLPRFVDPIMADNGRLYAGYEQDFVKAMREFCTKSDVIMPNLTEACLLADYPYLGETYDKTDIERLCERLSHLHNKHIILTGVSFEDDNVGLAHYDSKSGEITYHFSKAIHIISLEQGI